MIEEIQKLIDRYAIWLRDKTSLRKVNGDWVEICSPYLDRHNDYILLYAKKAEGGFLLTDGGFTIEDLEFSGCKLDSLKRRDLLNLTLAGFGIHINKEQHSLEVKTSPDNFSIRKHNLIQAILAVNDMFYLSQPMVTSLFYEDVVAWMDLMDIRYTPKVKFTGKSGFDHLFDFVIPRSRKKPERIIQTISRPNREMAESLAFKWVDTREVRPPESSAYALLNDDRSFSSGVVDALRNYDITPILWSKKQDFQEELVA